MFGAGLAILLAFLPWYTWYVSIGGIVVIMVDFMGIFACTASVLYVGLSFFFILQLFTMPFFWSIAFFFEIFLIPLAAFSPFLFLFGLIAWIVGDLKGLQLESAAF